MDVPFAKERLAVIHVLEFDDDGLLKALNCLKDLAQLNMISPRGACSLKVRYTPRPQFAAARYVESKQRCPAGGNNAVQQHPGSQGSGQISLLCPL